MPAPATPGASSATSGSPVPRVATAPTASTATLAISQGSSSDGVVSSALARPGDRSSRPAVRSTGPGRRRHTCAATPIHTRSRSTSGGGVAPVPISLIGYLPDPPAAQCRPEHPPGPVCPALHRPGRNPHELSYLGDRAVLHVDQPPHFAFRRPWRTECFDGIGQLSAGERGLGRI